MRRTCVILGLAIAAALVGSSALAATTFWLSRDAVGTPIAGNTINVAAGDTVKLYCFLESTEIGNTFELMVGYDMSDAGRYGIGTGPAHYGKLVLVSTQPAIEATMPASFTVLKSVGLDVSGMEEFNTEIGGRPFGFVGRAATFANEVPGQILCFSFTLRNDMTVIGDSQYVVVSNYAGANSYSSAWKYGTALREGQYALNVVTTEAIQKPVVGTSNKAVLDAIMTDAAPNYSWVLWGKVSERTESGFKIDDGSGVSITVSADGNTVADGDYVSVRGNLDASTKTLTSQEITKHN